MLCGAGLPPGLSIGGWNSEVTVALGPDDAVFWLPAGGGPWISDEVAESCWAGNTILTDGPQTSHPYSLKGNERGSALVIEIFGSWEQATKWWNRLE